MEVDLRNGTNTARLGRHTSIPSSVFHLLMKINRNHPHMSRLCTNFSLITCFAICLCASSYMFHLVDEILDESVGNAPENASFSVGVSSNNSRPNIMDLKAILEQRGIPVDTMLERKDLNAAIESTGSITAQELVSVRSNRKKMNELNISISADAHAFHNLLIDQDLTDQGDRTDPSHAHSIVFDSESEFIERVEDNKDSVWLLAVVPSKTRSNELSLHNNPQSILTDEVWAILVHRYISFGFKLGLLNCQKLHGICIDRGFIAADLILALPRGGDRMKDLVQFRPYPRESNPKQLSANRIAENIHVWVVSVLSERLRSLQTVDDILPASLSFFTGTNQVKRLIPHWSWLSKRTQPINVLWLPQGLTSNELLLRKSSLILSALSVPYTGRARFWVVHPSLLQKKSGKSADFNNNNKWALSDSGVDTISDLLVHLKCPPNSRFLILTPEAKCYNFGGHQGEFFSYDSLELCLRLLFPSANDFFCFSFVILNFFLMFNGAFLIAQTILVLIHNSNESLILQSEMHRSTRFGLANTVIRMVRRGWTSHVPNFWRISFQSSADDLGSGQSPDPSSSSHRRIQSPTSLHPVSKFSFVCSKLVICFKTLLVDFLSANLLLLLMILPLINLLSLNVATPFINLFLWFLRSMTMNKSVITLRLAISSGHMTLTRLLSVTFLLWFCLIISSMYIYSVVYGADKMLTHYTYSRRSRRNRLHPAVILERLNKSSPDQFWNELASFLLMSDKENRSDLTSATTSSTTESDNSAGTSTQTKEPRTQSPTKSVLVNPLISSAEISQSTNPELVEGSRLLRRLCRLHRVLCRQTDQLACVPPPPPPTSSLSSTFNGLEHNQMFDPVDNQSSRTTTTMTAAHMYTWQCSFSSKFSPIDKSPARTNDPNRNRIDHVGSGRLKVNDQIPPTGDLCYEAEDERDASSDEDVPSRSLIREHPVLTNRSNENMYGSSDLSSNEEYHDTDQEIPLGGNQELPTSSEVDVCTLGNPLDWPAWVVPCDACVVCWRKFRSGVRLSALPCGHGFHEVCIRRWLDTGALDCPVCRWPAYAPHLRQQCQMIGQLIEAVQAALNPIRKNCHSNTVTNTLSDEQQPVQ